MLFKQLSAKSWFYNNLGFESENKTLEQTKMPVISINLFFLLCKSNLSSKHRGFSLLLPLLQPAAFSILGCWVFFYHSALFFSLSFNCSVHLGPGATYKSFHWYSVKSQALLFSVARMTSDYSCKIGGFFKIVIAFRNKDKSYCAFMQTEDESQQHTLSVVITLSYVNPGSNMNLGALQQ